ncbi:MAG: prolyl oligopeptidase family serine peptidase [Gemmata sp.]
MFALPRALAAGLFLAALTALALLASVGARADGPKDNIVENVRPVPPVGNDIPEADRDALKKGLAELQQLIKDIGKHDLLPDVLIYEKAVRWALDHKEIFDPVPPKGGKAPAPAANVKKALAAGLERAKALKEGKTPWATQTGGVLRGYASKIDGDVQPYWMIVPQVYDFAATAKHRLDFWWHGRFENVSEANFMANAPGAGGIIPAPGALILHPYGRFSNANKFAGEVDTFECLEHAKRHYRIDESRLVARGFSMGGAACWQYGAHYPTLWAACAPGAGFSETPEFLKVFQGEDTGAAPWYEKKLWRWYNASDHAINFFNLPTVAYSGADDKQKQAADVMEREMKRVGLELKHIIGPKTGHSYEKDAKVEVNKLIDAAVARGKPAVPAEVKFVTYTLRYNQCAWLSVVRLEKHWEPATVSGTYRDDKVELKATGAAGLRVTLPAEPKNGVLINGARADGVWQKSGGGVSAWFEQTGGKAWGGPGSALHVPKKPGLQGPIDDAFMDAFVMVRPTGKAANAKVGEWVEKEMKHAVDHWRKQFRGDARVKSDGELTDADIANSNLILWGDPKSNAVLAKVADKLPIKWTDKGVVVGKDTYDAATHAPVLIYPNPLNPEKYVVVNSGFTYREYDYLNNARQAPKLPDYAIIDTATPPNARFPGKVVRGGFFGEKWELLEGDGK